MQRPWGQMKQETLDKLTRLRLAGEEGHGQGRPRRACGHALDFHLYWRYSGGLLGKCHRTANDSPSCVVSMIRGRPDVRWEASAGEQAGDGAFWSPGLVRKWESPVVTGRVNGVVGRAQVEVTAWIGRLCRRVGDRTEGDRASPRGRDG